MLLVGGTSLLAETQVGGSVDMSLVSGMNSGDLYRRDVMLDLEYQSMFENTEFKSVLRAEDDSLRVKEPSRIELREGYVGQTFNIPFVLNSIVFKAGKMIHTWGNADELKPVDIVNPQDMSFLLFKPIQERKEGLFSADLTFAFNGGFQFEGLYAPLFEPTDIANSKVFIPAKMKTLLTTPTVTILPSILPNEKLENGTFGARLAFSVYDVDGHFNYLNAYDHTPSFKTVLDMSAYPPVIMYKVTPVYEHIVMYGFDFQRALFSGISIRGELAYFDAGKYFDLKQDSSSTAAMMASPYGKSLVSGGTGIEERPYYEYTAGFDVAKLFVDHLYLNVQVNQQFIGDWSGALASDEIVTSMLGTLEYSLLRETIKLKARGFYNINDDAFCANAEATYKVSGNFDLSCGCWFIDGKGDSTYGQFKNNDMLYATGKVTF